MNQVVRFGWITDHSTVHIIMAISLWVSTLLSGVGPLVSVRFNHSSFLSGDATACCSWQTLGCRKIKVFYIQERKGKYQFDRCSLIIMILKRFIDILCHSILTIWNVYRKRNSSVERFIKILRKLRWSFISLFMRSSKIYVYYVCLLQLDEAVFMSTETFFKVFADFSEFI